jgi:hypothetical protein
MTKTNKPTFYTGIKFFGQKILIESTGKEDVDVAMKQLFHDDYKNTASLDLIREDVQLVLAWSRDELEEPAIEPKKQMELFE